MDARSFPILDAHVHLWDPQQLSYPWLSEAPDIDRAFVGELVDRESQPPPGAQAPANSAAHDRCIRLTRPGEHHPAGPASGRAKG